jgi:S-disulfanyl-L-cysteine oxidoreductase SoxD
MMGSRSASSWNVAAAAIAAMVTLVFAEVTAGNQGASKTVLDGVFTAAQAERGAAAYDAQCAGCHEGADVNGAPLTDAPFVDRWREDTLDGLFEFIKTRMPQSNPGSLTDAAYLDILAHLLHKNEFPAGPRELAMDILPGILLVGHDGPKPLPNGALVQVVGCVAQNPARERIIARASQPVRARVGDAITAAEVTTSAGTALGSQTFTLLNISEGGTALSADGHKVLVKGALTQRAGVGRIHVTVAKSVAQTCE